MLQFFLVHAATPKVVGGLSVLYFILYYFIISGNISLFLVIYVIPKAIIFSVYYIIIFLFIARKTSLSINSDSVHLVWTHNTR